MRSSPFRPSLSPRWATGVLVIGVWALTTPSGFGQALQSRGDVDLNQGVPKDVQNVTVEQQLGETIPQDLVLTDSKGNRVSSGDYFDGQRPTIVTLNYSDCPMLCSVQLNALTRSLEEVDLELGTDFRVLTVSIDPTEPTKRVAQTKSSYVGQLPSQPRAQEGWVFCTASQDAIDALTDALGFRYRYDAASGEYYHPAMLAFVSPDGVISRYSLEVNFPPDQLKLAILEAGEGKVGSPVDQFILWCYSYDPDRNSYVPQAWRIMRLGGGVTVLGMLAFLIPYWVGRKRAPIRPGSEDLAPDRPADTVGPED